MNESKSQPLRLCVSLQKENGNMKIKKAFKQYLLSMLMLSHIKIMYVECRNKNCHTEFRTFNQVNLSKIFEMLIKVYSRYLTFSII